MLPSSEGVEIFFDASLFSKDSIQKAAFRMGEAYSAEIGLGEGTFKVRLTPTGSIANLLGGSIEGEFRRCVLDELLREKVLRETQAIRQLLLETAFSRAMPKRAQATEP